MTARVESARELSKKFKFEGAGDEPPHYEVDVAWRFRGGHVDIVTTSVSEDDFNSTPLFMYLVSYLSNDKEVTFEWDKDWHWFDGDSDAMWTMLARPAKYAQEDPASLKMVGLRYVAANGTSVKVKPPRWMSLFKGPNDQAAKMGAAIAEWYKSDWDEADKYEDVDEGPRP